MIVRPKVRGFICITAHPAGCAEHVRQQIGTVRARGMRADYPRRVLVLGASTGYGLASRIVPAFGGGASTLGVILERPTEGSKTASAGHYNTVAFERAAHAEGLYARTINGDAFSPEIKERTLDLVRRDLGQVDLVVYSLAAPRRTDPRTGAVMRSVLKPVGAPFTSKTVDPERGIVSEITIEPATDQEIAETVGVMGGEDWQLWIEALDTAGLLADGARTVAYSYIGPELTWAVYRNGTIGRAKEHLEATALRLRERLATRGGDAFVSVNKALVTQASSAIPVVPLYISLLYRVMKERGLHEGCIEQIVRLFDDRLYAAGPVPVDDRSRIRLDDWEMKPEVQAAVAELWSRVETANLTEISDLEGYRSEFLRLFGFGWPGIDEEADVEIDVPIPSMV